MAERLDPAAFAQLDRFMPGFREELGGLPLAEVEREGGPGIGAYRRAGGPGLLVPESFGGGGLSVLEAMAVQRGVGRLAPSTAVATTMHQFSIATLVEVTKLGGGMEWLVVESIARQQLLVASGFAEGDAGGAVLRPRVEVEVERGGYRISGTKKPCSLSRSMDMLAVSLLAENGDGERLGVALVSAKDPGLTVAPFWRNPVLGGAETGEVTLDRVRVPESVMSWAGTPDELDEVQKRGYLWFELLIASAYAGIAGRLVAEGIAVAGAEAAGAVEAASQIETAVAALDGAGQAFAALDPDGDSTDLLARTLLVRQGVEDLLVRATDLGFGMVGAIGFALSDEAATLLAASRALAWHPPSRRRSHGSLASYLGGGPLKSF